MAYTLVNPGDPIHASQIMQIINSLIGTAAAGQVLSFSALNDSTHYALTVQNQDGTNSNALNVLKSDGTVILQARGTGVTVSALSVTGLTAFQGGVQIGPNTNTLVRPMPNDSSSMLVQSPNYVNAASLGGTGVAALSFDSYYDGTAWQRGTSTTAQPSLFSLSSGGFGWYVVPAGSGAMPGWTQAMGLAGSGDLTLYTGGLHVNAGVVDAASWVRAQNGALYLGTSGTGVSWDGANIVLTPSSGGVVQTRQLGGAWAQFQTAQVNFEPSGGYITNNGNDLLYRSVSGNHILQRSDSTYNGTLSCGALNTNGQSVTSGAHTASSDITITSGNLHVNSGAINLTTLGGLVGVVVDNAAGGNWNGYAPNGSGNFRWQHADGTWCGTQGANFQTMSDASLKSDIQPLADADCTSRLRMPDLPVITWVPQSGDGRDVGFTAQQLAPVVPEVVYTDSEGLGSISYGNLTAVLWGALRDLDARCQAKGI